MGSKRFKKRIRIVWIVISVLAVISMVGFSMAPMFNLY